MFNHFHTLLAAVYEDKSFSLDARSKTLAVNLESEAAFDLPNNDHH